MNMLPASKVSDKAWRDDKDSFNEECPWFLAVKDRLSVLLKLEDNLGSHQTLKDFDTAQIEVRQFKKSRVIINEFYILKAIYNIRACCCTMIRCNIFAYI